MTARRRSTMPDAGAATHRARVAILWRGDREERLQATSRNSRFSLVFEDLEKVGVEAEPAVYEDETYDEVLAQLRGVSAVLVWVNPIQDGRTRTHLNELLRQIASEGIWVSTHPDVIAKIGVKRILHRTRSMGWGTDTELYGSFTEFEERFPACLVDGQARVIKQDRGNGGEGVWKVERTGRKGAEVRVWEALPGRKPRRMALADFMASCEAYFQDNGAIVDQPFQPRLRDGMVRCYVSEDRVVGFAHQYPQGLMTPKDMHPDASQGKVMLPAEAPPFQRLRQRMEAEWIPQLMASCRLGRDDMPVIWDADFLYGPTDHAGADTYVLCEINVSSVYAIPDQASAELARCVARRLSGAATA